MKHVKDTQIEFLEMKSMVSEMKLDSIITD